MIDTERLTALKNRLAPLLSEKRFNHSLAVMKEAIRLAQYWQVDWERAAVAGLLHDIAKELSAETLIDYAERSGLTIPDDIGLLHGPVGAIILKSEWGITDSEILSAIHCHTLSKKDMTVFEKLISLADLIAEGRDFEGLNNLRKLAYTDLDTAMGFSIKRRISHVEIKGKALFPGTAELYEHYLNKARNNS